MLVVATAGRTRALGGLPRRRAEACAEGNVSEPWPMTSVRQTKEQQQNTTISSSSNMNMRARGAVPKENDGGAFLVTVSADSSPVDAANLHAKLHGSSYMGSYTG